MWGEKNGPSPFRLSKNRGIGSCLHPAVVPDQLVKAGLVQEEHVVAAGGDRTDRRQEAVIGTQDVPAHVLFFRSLRRRRRTATRGTKGA